MTDLDRQIRRGLGVLADEAPAPPPFDEFGSTPTRARMWRRPLALVAAAVLLVAIVVLWDGGDEQSVDMVDIPPEPTATASPTAEPTPSPTPALTGPRDVDLDARTGISTGSRGYAIAAEFVDSGEGAGWATLRLDPDEGESPGSGREVVATWTPFWTTGYNHECGTQLRPPSDQPLTVASSYEYRTEASQGPQDVRFSIYGLDPGSYELALGNESGSEVTFVPLEIFDCTFLTMTEDSGEALSHETGEFVRFYLGEDLPLRDLESIFGEPETTIDDDCPGVITYWFSSGSTEFVAHHGFGVQLKDGRVSAIINGVTPEGIGRGSPNPDVMDALGIDITSGGRFRAGAYEIENIGFLEEGGLVRVLSIWIGDQWIASNDGGPVCVLR